MTIRQPEPPDPGVPGDRTLAGSQNPNGVSAKRSGLVGPARLIPNAMRPSKAAPRNMRRSPGTGWYDNPNRRRLI